MDADKLVKVYTKIRDERSRRKKVFDDEDKALKAKQERIEAELLRFLNENKLDNSRTDSGMFYRQLDILPAGSDWEAFYEWVAKEGAFDALERRIKKGFISDYMEENDGDLPPGVSVNKRYVLRVRRN